VRARFDQFFSEARAHLRNAQSEKTNATQQKRDLNFDPYVNALRDVFRRHYSDNNLLCSGTPRYNCLL
jgi:hypothetical protein